VFKHEFISFPRGKRRARSADFRWFDVTKYQAASKFGLSDWLQALRARYEAFLRFPEGTFVMPNELVLALLSDPIEFHRLQRDRLIFVQSEHHPAGAIEDLTMIDAFRGLESEVAGKVLSDLASFHDWRTNDDPHDLSKRRMPGPASRTIRSLLASNEGMDGLPVWVDLNADDEHLIASFGKWLSRVRLEFGPANRSQSWSERSLQSWIDFRVLPFIDLNIYCSRIAELQLTQAVAGSLLFPDEIDVDLTERVRKVVIPLAERLLSYSFLLALYRRVNEPEGEAGAVDSGTPNE
jgi:hypothetical protein